MKYTIRFRREMMKVAFHYSLSPSEASSVLDITISETKEYVATLSDSRAAARYIYLALKKRIEPQFDFNATLTALQKDVNNFAYFLTRDRERAFDLSQNALLKALLNKDKFKPKGDPIKNMKSWLISITHNEFHSENRKTERHTRLNPLITRDELFEEDYSAIDVTIMLNTLPKRQKKVVEMIKQGYKAKEIAETLGVSVSMVRDDNYRAKKFLRTRR